MCFFVKVITTLCLVIYFSAIRCSKNEILHDISFLVVYISSEVFCAVFMLSKLFLKTPKNTKSKLYLGYLLKHKRVFPMTYMLIESLVCLLMAIGYIATSLLIQPNLWNQTMAESHLSRSDWMLLCMLTSGSLFSGIWFVVHSIYSVHTFSTDVSRRHKLIRY